MSLLKSDTESARSLNNLPDDVLLAILRFCDTRSLCVLSRVSRNLYRLAKDDSLWKDVALRCVNVHPSNRKSGWNWKELYKVSWNWTHGYCKDRNLLKFKFNLMPWIQLGRFRELYVAQATDVILYKIIKYNGQLSWQPVRTYSGHHGDICKFVVRNGQLVSSSMDNSIRSWDLQTGKCKDIFRGHSSDVNSVDCFDDVIVSGSKDKTVKVWSLQNLSCVHTVHVEDNVWSVSPNPSFRSVVSGSSGHTRGVSPLQLWDIDSGKLIRSLVSGVNRLGAGVRGLKWESPHTLLSCSYDTSVRMWDVRLGCHSVSSCVLKWDDPHDSVVYCIDSDGKWMVISGTNRYGVVRIWDKRFRKCVQMYYAGKKSFSPVYSLSFNRTSLFVALASGVRMLDFTV
ncbi:F-box/WD repeat-containing protein 4-like [Acropora millepora]|uniref:F-box/WD repeat-containing protein 4-like n=1 Tax=Acropora millepora TaxID=45264 RepID=UPI001CF37FBC|nr:F-box/WD repeat-containing protein 4-like [Acropora millepora]XP_044176890.1 F-box/WD repeat-containing protein 4-like [Acropora millepora]